MSKIVNYSELVYASVMTCHEIISRLSKASSEYIFAQIPLETSPHLRDQIAGLLAKRADDISVRAGLLNWLEAEEEDCAANQIIVALEPHIRKEDVQNGFLSQLTENPKIREENRKIMIKALTTVMNKNELADRLGLAG